MRGLPPPLQDKAVALARVSDFANGAFVFHQGTSDELVHFLLAGRIELLWNERVTRSLSATNEAALHAFAPPGRKRYSARAAGHATVATFPRTALDRLLLEFEATPGLHARAADAIATANRSDWMVRLLQSEPFSVLPAANVQRIFARLEELPCRAGDTIIRQGEAGDCYYVIAAGRCEISRAIASGRGQIHLADLGPGATFGEESLVSGALRSASAKMLTDGLLLRLNEDDFRTLILEEVLHAIAPGAARRRVDEGAVWLDVRQPEDFAAYALAASENIPLSLLRTQSEHLRRDFSYIVCSDDVEQSRIAAFLLGARGFSVEYLDATVESMLQRHRSRAPRGDVVAEPADPGPGTRIVPFSPARARTDAGHADDGEFFFDNTVTRIPASARPGRPHDATNDDAAAGRELADILDELADRHEELARAYGPDDTRGDPEPAGPIRSARPGTAEDVLEQGIARIVQDMEDRLGSEVRRALEASRAELEADYASTCARMQDRARVELERKQASVRQAFESRYQEKEQLLRGYYKQLIALASRISRQKAQLEEARRQFELKFESANRLYREVEEMRDILSDHIESLDSDAIEDIPRLSVSQ